MATKNKKHWYFAALNHGEAEGLNDPLLETFEGDYEYYIARETIQNAIDAQQQDSKSPVKVIFERFEMPTKNLIGSKELREHFKKCCEQTPEDVMETKEHFERGLKMLGRKNISMLKISDYNTVGLDGADEDTSGRWYRLIKAVGLNKMTGVGGGSFGIGKGAPLAASPIRTVFYTSLSDKGELVFQGKTKLITHEYDKEIYRGTGFLGCEGEGWKALRGDKNVPKEFLRKEKGTDLYILGYSSDEDDWKTPLARSIAENFWMAIHDGDLEVTLVDGKSELKMVPNRLYQLLQEYSPGNALPYYLAVTKPDVTKEDSIDLIGKCQLFVKQGENFPKKVAMMRKAKMTVKEKMYRGPDEWAGVFVCVDDAGNKILRDMEPPQHDDWQEARNKENGKKVIRSINDWVKGTLKEMSETDTGSPEEIPGLDQFLPFDDSAEMEGGNTPMEASGSSQEEESPYEIGKTSAEIEEMVESYVQKPGKASEGSGVAEFKPSDGDAGDGGDGGDIPGDDNKNVDSMKMINTSELRFRVVAANSKRPEEYCLIIDPRINQEGAIGIIGVGDDSNYQIPLNSAESWDKKKKLFVHGSYVKDIKLKRGQKTKIRLMTQSTSRYALGIENHEG